MASLNNFTAPDRSDQVRLQIHPNYLKRYYKGTKRVIVLFGPFNVRCEGIAHSTVDYHR